MNLKPVLKSSNITQDPISHTFSHKEAHVEAAGVPEAKELSISDETKLKYVQMLRKQQDVTVTLKTSVSIQTHFHSQARFLVQFLQRFVSQPLSHCKCLSKLDFVF